MSGADLVNHRRLRPGLGFSVTVGRSECADWFGVGDVGSGKVSTGYEPNCRVGTARKNERCWRDGGDWRKGKLLPGDRRDWFQDRRRMGEEEVGRAGKFKRAESRNMSSINWRMVSKRRNKIGYCVFLLAHWHLVTTILVIHSSPILEWGVHTTDTRRQATKTSDGLPARFR